MSESFQDRLRRYARLAVRVGVNVQPGQELIVGADVGEVEFVRLVTEEAYRAGAKNVFAFYSDEPSTLIRFDQGSDEAIAYSPQWFSDALADNVRAGGSFLRVYGANPALLKNVPPEKVAVAGRAQAVANAKFSEINATMAANWSIVAHASPGWAQAVFPDLSADAAVQKLWEAIFACTCVDTPDPVKAWNDHAAQIEQRRDALNAMDLTTLHFKSPGTDLRVGLAEGHKFAGGRVKTGGGIVCSPNIPTEEVFTMPHKDRVDGVVRSTKALSLRGNMIDGIEMKFEGGKVLAAKATAGEEVLNGLLDTDEGARRLGEVALVPNSSRVSRANMLFLNTLYDENAACHIAVGQALTENLSGGKEMSAEERQSHGMNSSMIHIDWMIGSGETDLDGTTADGSTIPLMRSGEWAF